ncbi:MAG: RloB family protein [Candidatus Thiodiazotropha sp. L084R]
MGRDNQPKARQRRQLERKLNRRASYDRILIVSEGTKTEPLYFNEIRTAYRLHTANVQVMPCETGTAPIQVVEYAHDLFINGDPHKRIRPRAFERIYAVFDRDDHESYFQALDRAQALDGKLRNDSKQAIQFRAIASIPCFELWLLLHFEDITAPLGRNEVLARLKQHIPSYDKGLNGTFALTVSNLPSATQKTEQLAQENSAYTDPMPYTGVVELVRFLTEMRS